MLPFATGSELGFWQTWWLRFKPDPVTISTGERLRSGFAALLAVFATTALSQLLPGQGVWMLAAVGASSVLMFVLPSGPLSQPWPVIGGYLVSALAGVTCATWVPHLPLAAALAVSGAILAMLWLRCVHPPGGAVALYAVLGGEAVHALGYRFVLMPALANAVLLVGAALVANNLLPHRHYPRRPPSPPPQSALSPASAGLTPSHRDVAEALAQYDRLLDISEEDLDAVVGLLAQRMFERSCGPLRVADVMLADAPSVRADAPTLAAWRTLRRHRLPAIAVVDGDNRLVGLVGMNDFIDRSGARSAADLRRRIARYLLHNMGRDNTVAALMVPPVVTARADMHIAELMPWFGPHACHSIPVVNRAHQYVGMVSAAAMIAALYRAKVSAQRPAT
jgi:CBS domain-containing membrane protein